MTIKAWLESELNKAFGAFDWDYVVEDDSDMDFLDDRELTGNFAYLVVKQRDNEFFLNLFEDLAKAKDYVKEAIQDGDCMANGGRGGPDLVSEWLILDLVERKVINVNRLVLVEFTKEE